MASYVSNHLTLLLMSAIWYDFQLIHLMSLKKPVSALCSPLMAWRRLENAPWLAWIRLQSPLEAWNASPD